MGSGTTKALWVAPYEAELTDGTKLVPGVTVVEVPASEAEASENWGTPRPPSRRRDEGGEG